MSRIVLIGPGAIGGITAARMAQSGLDVTLVCKRPEITDKCNAAGLHITGAKGEATVPVKAVNTPEDLDGLYDLCMIATKAYDMADCARRVLPHLKADSLVVSMQNGICTDMLAEVVGWERTVGCVIGFGATMHGACELEMTSTGEFIIGMMHGCSSPRMEELKAALSCVVPCTVATDMYAELYSKLIINSCITSLGAVCGLTLGEMMARGDARRIFLSVIGEAVEVAKALAIDVPPYGGKLNYFSLMKGTGFIDDLRRHVMIRVVGMKYSKLKSSSLQSLERGRPTEIDCFNGYIAQKGREAGVQCPVNERLVAMVKEIERGERKICVENLADAGLQAKT